MSIAESPKGVETYPSMANELVHVQNCHAQNGRQDVSLTRVVGQFNLRRKHMAAAKKTAAKKPAKKAAAKKPAKKAAKKK